VGDAGLEDPRGRGPLDLVAVEDDAPARRRQEPRDRAQRGGLARAVGADQADQLARRDGEVEPASAATGP